jgi:hypothetical protein
MQLSLSGARAPGGRGWISVLGLRGFDEQLLGIQEGGPADSLWVDGEAVWPANPFKLIQRQSSNDWAYASVDMTPLPLGRVKRFIRHLLHVQPDLFIVCDEFLLAGPSAIETGWWFPANVTRDPAREEWRLQSPKAGLTARILGMPKNIERLWPMEPGVHGAACARSGVTNQTPEFRQLLALVPHEGHARRSLAFKLLESDTAIGLRVHRDGLPTLVAFRKDSVAGEANLTGLKFTGAVAVDIFRPKRK